MSKLRPAGPADRWAVTRMFQQVSKFPTRSGLMTRFAIEGTAVVVPGPIALMLERELKLNDLRREVRGRNRLLDEVLSDWHTVALIHADQVASDCGSVVAPTAETAGCLKPEGMTTAQVAHAVGCNSRTVRLAAQRGQLNGFRSAGGWWFAIEDVAVWVAQRSQAR